MKAILDTLFPRSCLITGKACDVGVFDWITSEIEDLKLIKESRCTRCGSSLGGYLKNNYGCTLCQELDPLFKEARALARYDGPVGRLLRELKYKRAYYTLTDLRTIMSFIPDLEDWLEDTYIVPVPLHKKQFRNRGFNQSEVLARLVVESFPNTEFQDVLERVKQTQTQTKLDRKERTKNVSRAFSIKENVEIKADKNYLILDDIITTGATLNACSELLLKAGAKEVRVLTFAHG